MGGSDQNLCWERVAGVISVRAHQFLDQNQFAQVLGCGPFVRFVKTTRTEHRIDLLQEAQFENPRSL